MARVGSSEGGADVRARQFWIVVVARDAAVAGAAAGYLQVGSGKAGPLERMQGGDGFVLYSPRPAGRLFSASPAPLVLPEH